MEILNKINAVSQDKSFSHKIARSIEQRMVRPASKLAPNFVDVLLLLELLLDEIYF